MKLYELAEKFCDSNRRMRADSTRKAYEVALRHLARALGHEPELTDLTDDTIVALERYLSGRSSYTINGHTARIKSLWRWAAKRNLINHWPTIDRLPVRPPYTRAWDTDDVEQLLAACKKMRGLYVGVRASLWWRVWHVVQWETGERTGGMLAMRWANVDTKHSGIYLAAEDRKGRQKDAWYRLSCQGMEELETIRRPERMLIFQWELSMASFWLHYGKLLKTAGLPSDRWHKPQMMRRTHLTWWARGGGDATSRAQHSSRQITERHYLDRRLLPEDDPADRLPKIG